MAFPSTEISKVVAVAIVANVVESLEGRGKLFPPPLGLVRNIEGGGGENKSIMLAFSSSPELLDDDKFCDGGTRVLLPPLPLTLPIDILLCLRCCFAVVEVVVVVEANEVLLAAKVSRRVALVTIGGAKAALK